MPTCRWRPLLGAALLGLLLLAARAVRADAQGERFSLVQDRLDAGDRHLAVAVLALLDPPDPAAAAAALSAAANEAATALDGLGGVPAAGRDRPVRALERLLHACQRRIDHAQLVLGDPTHGPDTARAATTQARKAMAAVQRQFGRLTTLGPLLVLTELQSDRCGLYDGGETVRFTVRSLDGTGEPCPSLELTVAGDRAGVVDPTVIPVSSAPHAFAVNLGSTPGLAEVWVSGCGLLRRAYLVNRGSAVARTLGTELLALVDTPTCLATAGNDWLAWSDASDNPVKVMPSGGGAVTALATRLVAPARLVASGGSLYLLDIRGGTAPDGSTGNAVIRVLKRASPGGGESLYLGSGGNTVPDLTTDLVVAGDYVYWVVGRSSPDACTIQRFPTIGGPAADLHTSAGRAITALAADATHLYWSEGALPAAGTIRRLPLAGGAVETFYESPTAIGGALAIGAGRLYVADLTNHRLIALPLAGGLPQFVADTPGPLRLVTDDRTLYWLDAAALRSLPLAGGAVTTLVDGRSTLTDLCVDAEYVFWTESGGSGHGSRGTVARIVRGGGHVVTLAVDARTPVALAVLGDTVHWCEGGSIAAIEGYGRVAHTGRHGGPVAATLNGVAQTMPPIAADATAVYVADGWTLKRLPRDGTSAEELAAGDFYITALATDGSRVAWIESDPFGTVRCVPTTGGFVQTLGSLNDYAGRIALDAGAVYAVGGLDQVFRLSLTAGTGATPLLSAGLIEDLLVAGGWLAFADSANRAIYRMSPTGGTPTWLAGLGAQDWSCRLATDGTTLFWLTSSTLGRVPLAGGPSRVLQTSLPSDPGMRVANAIIVGGDYVYWTVVLGDGTGGILRTAQRRSSPLRLR